MQFVNSYTGTGFYQKSGQLTFNHTVIEEMAPTLFSVALIFIKGATSGANATIFEPVAAATMSLALDGSIGVPFLSEPSRY
jgi:hypothetical protein